MLAAVLAASVLASTPRASATTTGGYGSYAQVAVASIPDTASRQALASRYGLVVLRGTIKSSVLTDLRNARPDIRILAYEQAAGLNSNEVDTIQASHPEWLARDCSGNLIHPSNIPDTTLADLTNAGFRDWKAQEVAGEVAVGTDGSFLDTLGVYYPDTFYTGRPCINGVPITDTGWRDGSADLLTRTRAASGKPTIANGFGLGSGGAYYGDPTDADVVINAADGVQIENFTRTANTPVTNYYGDAKWKQDINFLSLLGNRGKTALAYTKVAGTATADQLTALRDYAAGTFLEGFVPGDAWFGFTDPSDVPTVDSFPGWAAPLGSPAGPATISTDVTRVFSGGSLTMTDGQPPRVAPVFNSAASTTFLAGSAASFTVTAAGSPAPAITETGPLPSGVTFKDNGNGTALLAGTAAQGTGGTYPLTFTASSNASSATQQFTLTVNEAPAITSANSSTFVVGTAGAFTMTTRGFPKPSLTKTGVLPAGVTFTPNSDGTATLAGTPAAGTAGNYALTLTASNGVGSNATQSFTLVVKSPSTTSLTTSAATATYGTQVTFTATVKASSGATPTGTVTFFDGATALGPPVTLSGTGTATLATSKLTGGSHSITAAYNGAALIVPSTSPALTEVVNRASSATAITSTPSPSQYRQAVTVTATVTSSAGTPTGQVTFKDGSTTLGTASLDSTGHASFVTSALAVGSHSLTAAYAGDTNFGASASPSRTQSVKKAATATALTSSANPAAYGSPVTFTAAVTSAWSTPTVGTVTFKKGATTLATVALDGTGHATFTTSTLPKGTNNITASYSGKAGAYVASTSAVLTQTVN